MRSSDSHGTFRPRFFLVALPYHLVVCRSLPLPADTPVAGQENFWPVSPRTGSFGWVEHHGPPRFLGNPNVYMPCSSTPARWLVPGLFSTTVQPSAVSKSSALAVRSFRGSITRPAHSLSTLRNAGYPFITQDSLPVGGQPLPGGISTHWVPHAISEQLPVAHSKRPGFPGAPRPDPCAC